MRRSVTRFLSDRDGAVAATSAVLLTVLMGFAALGVDLGRIYTDQRRAQSAVDLAAIAAASDIGNGTSAVRATIAGNGYGNDATYSVQYGVYNPDPSVAPAARFTPDPGSDANAARVTLRSSTPLFFARLLTGKDDFAITTTATATQSAFASFAIGSRLAAIDGGLLNQILGGLLGTSLSLSAMDYQSLLAAKIDLFDFMGALATRLALDGPTYDSVLRADAGEDVVVQALIDTTQAKYGAAGAAVQALRSVQSAVQSSSASIPLASLIDAGPYRQMPAAEKPKVGVSASVYDLLTATAQIANHQHQIETALALNVPGIAAVSLKLAVGERPQGTSWVTVGAAGASVHTAQTRLLLSVQLAGAAPASLVNVPIYVEIASGTAALSRLTCGFPDVAASTATLNVTPGAVDAWIGDVSGSEFTNFSAAPNPPPATLVDTPLVKVKGRAHAAVTNLSATPVTFAYADILSQSRRTVGTADYTSSLLRSLLSDTQLSITTLGLTLGAPAISSLVGTTLAAATSPVDQMLSSVLQTLGVGIGQADVWMLGIRCDGAVLVL